MFEPTKAVAAIPAQDLERAKAFYRDKLGFEPSQERTVPFEDALYRVGQTEFLVFRSSGKPSGDHTQLGFELDDVPDAVASLRDRGVVFEEYDLPGLTTVNGVAEVEGVQGAWFRDSEGNLLSLAPSSI